MRLPICTSLLLIVLASACSSEEGILIEATTEMGDEIATLRFYVGANGRNAGRAGNYYQQQVTPVDVSVLGRSLSADPFVLQLGSETTEDKPIVVGVMALNEGGEVIGYGHTDGTVQFIPGKLLKWKIPIIALDSDYFFFPECMKWRNAPDAPWEHVSSKLDKDCDGVNDIKLGGEDCDDRDPSVTFAVDDDDDGYDVCARREEGEQDCDDSNERVYPGAPALCDGIINDCRRGDDDAPTDPGEVTCYRSDANGLCLSGLSVCDGGVVQNDCELNAAEGIYLEEVCENYQTCMEYPDPLVCVGDVPPPTPVPSISCHLNFTSDGLGGEPASLCGTVDFGSDQMAGATIPVTADCTRIELIANEVNGVSFALLGIIPALTDKLENCQDAALVVQFTGTSVPEQPVPIRLKTKIQGSSDVEEDIEVQVQLHEECEEKTGLECSTDGVIWEPLAIFPTPVPN